MTKTKTKIANSASIAEIERRLDETEWDVSGTVKTVTYSHRIKHVTLPENYTIVDGTIFDMNTGLRVGCILMCSCNSKGVARLLGAPRCANSPKDCFLAKHLLSLPSADDE